MNKTESIWAGLILPSAKDARNIVAKKVAPLRKFKVFVYAPNSRNIQSEDNVNARNMFEARKPFLDKGIEAHRLYVLDVTK